MSYLTPPQINFQGNCYSNPSTGNNNDYAYVFDVDTLKFGEEIEVLHGSHVEQPAPPEDKLEWPQNPSESDYSHLRDWLMGLMGGIPESESKSTKGQQAHWNYYGDHATRFENTSVRQVVLGPDQSADSSDPLVGAKVEILGDIFYQQRRSPVIVDADPYGLVTSQIFTGQLKVTAQDGTELIVADPPTRAFSYFINPFKNVDPSAFAFQPVSASFTFSVFKDMNLTINANNSPSLQALQRAVDQGAGLNIRYCFYDAIYEIGPEERHQAFNANPANYPANPYVGLVLGTIGALGQGELATAPLGRKLYVQKRFQYSPPPPSRQAEEAVPKVRKYHMHGEHEAPNMRSASSGPPQAQLGPALAHVDREQQTVWLDLINTFPEDNVKTNTKLPLGPILLMVQPDEGEPLPLGSVPNNKEQYESHGGMCPINYAGQPGAELLHCEPPQGRLLLWSEERNEALLEEVPSLDVQTDDRAVYFEEQDIFDNSDGSTRAEPGKSKIDIEVYRKGELVQEPTVIHLEYWMCAKKFVDPSKPQIAVPSKYFHVDGASEIAPTIYKNPLYGRPGAGEEGQSETMEVITDAIEVPAGGKLTLHMTALRAGVSMIRYVDPQGGEVVPNFAWDNVDFSIVRILPYDDAYLQDDDTINNWKFIYDHFFSYFSLLYPVMSKIIPWGPEDAPDDVDRVKSFASQIRNFTSKEMWESTIYMPVTREMSDSKRRLLHRWCNLQEN